MSILITTSKLAPWYFLGLERHTSQVSLSFPEADCGGKYWSCHVFTREECQAIRLSRGYHLT
jgi:hypothetical protein